MTKKIFLGFVAVFFLFQLVIPVSGVEAAVVNDFQFYKDVEGGLVPPRIAVINLLLGKYRGPGGDMMYYIAGNAEVYGCQEDLLSIQSKYGFGGGVVPTNDHVAQLTGATHALLAGIGTLPAAGPSWERFDTPEQTTVIWTGSRRVDCSGSVSIGAPERAPDKDESDEEFWKELTGILNSPNKDTLLGLEPIPLPDAEDDLEEEEELVPEFVNSLLWMLLILFLLFVIARTFKRQPRTSFN